MQRQFIAVLIGLAVAATVAAHGAEPAGRTYSFPAVDELPDQPNMPDPFRKPDGSGVATRAEWQEQRAYLKALLEHYLYGHLPPRPDPSHVSFALTSDETYTPPDSAIPGRKQGDRIVLSRHGLTHFFSFNLWRPAEHKRYPVLNGRRT